MNSEVILQVRRSCESALRKFCTVYSHDRREPKGSRTLFCSACSEPVCYKWIMAVFCSTEAARTRGMFVRGKRHFCLPTPESILCGEEAQGLESRELSCLPSPCHTQIRVQASDLCVSLCTGSLHPIKRGAGEVNGSHVFNNAKLISAYYFPEYGQKAETFIDTDLALKTGCCS